MYPHNEQIDQSARIYRSGSADDSKRRNKLMNKVQQQTKFDRTLCVLVPIIFFLLLGVALYNAQHTYGSSQQNAEVFSVEHLISSDKKIQNYIPEDFYWFSVSTKDLILNSDLDSLYRRDRKVYSIDRETHLRAILLTQLIHNIDFKGNIKVQLSPFDDFSIEKKQQIIKRVMQFQKSYYDKTYNITKYENHQLPFCIVVPSYNNVKSRLYLRNLDSLFMQDYQNYRIVYIDDHSPEKTGQFVQKYIDEKKIPTQKIKLIINDVNKKALQNIYEGIRDHCKDGEIVGLIDGDDSLNGRQVLKLYNALFHQNKTAFIYSNFLKITANSRTQFGFGSQLSKQYFQAGYLRTYWPIIGTHFMAFYADLFRHIKKQDLCYQNGTFYDYAYDRAIITPLLQLSYPRNIYVPEMVYEYRNDTGINDGGFDWKRVSNLIQQRPAYKNLKQFPFIDQNPIIKAAQTISK